MKLKEKEYNNLLERINRELEADFDLGSHRTLDGLGHGHGR